MTIRNVGMPLHNIRMMIGRAQDLGLIRLEKDWSIILSSDQLALLKQIDALIERIRHGITARRMMYDHAELCTMPLDDQAKLDDDREEVLRFTKLQRKGLKQLVQASNELPVNSQAGSINNPNIIVNCDSGTEGELGCTLGYIKVYQAVFAASYGANDWKDVFVYNVHGHDQIVIQPAAGGKCNVSIGNPFRIAGWYLNYVNQGSRKAVIRMWEIPSEYFVKTMLRYCGTEKQIKDKNNKDVYFVEMCDHKAVNQFGVWTHKVVGEQLVPTTRGKEFAGKGRNLITYYDPAGDHEPSKRDGQARDVRELFKHLGIATLLTDRFHDYGMSVSDAEGNLTMNDDALQRDLHMLQVIDLLQDKRTSSTEEINSLDQESVRLFANLLSYNNLSPEKENRGVRFTATGLDVQNLRHETRFMAMVYDQTPGAMLVSDVVQRIHDGLVKNDDLKDDVLDSLSKAYFGRSTYKAVLARARDMLGKAPKNRDAIDGLNLLLRPLCSGDGSSLGVTKVSTKGQVFKIKDLSDIQFEIGKSHRSERKGHENLSDPLSGHTGGGFVPFRGFTHKLDKNAKSSNTSVQLSLHDPVVQRLRSQGIPLLGGISGTTRDIFAMINPLIRSNAEYWSFFSVVAAFMIKNHYHTLVECFIAANQIRPVQRTALPWSTVGQYYREIGFWTGVAFYP